MWAVLLFSVALFVHIVSAVVVMGPIYSHPFFILTVKKPRDIKVMYSVWDRILYMARYGDILMLTSGAVLMWLGGWGFNHLWLDASIVLFITMIIVIKTVEGRALGGLVKFVGELDESDPDFVTKYKQHAKAVWPSYFSVYGLNVAILILMIIKP